MTVERPTYVLIVRPERNVADPVRALRALLKVSLRRFGLRCVSAHESLSEGNDHEDAQTAHSDDA